MSGYFHVFQKYPILRRTNNIVANTGCLVGVGGCTVVCVCMQIPKKSIINIAENYSYSNYLYTIVETAANTGTVSQPTVAHPHTPQPN